MYNKNTYIARNIKIHGKIRKSLILFCAFLLVCSVLTFGFYGFSGGNKAIKFVSSYEDIKKKKIEKVMINPRMKFEHSPNQFYDIEAKKAVHENEEDILMFDVFAKGETGNIRAGRLQVTQNGDKLHFSDRPVLIIKQVEEVRE